MALDWLTVQFKLREIETSLEGAGVSAYPQRVHIDDGSIRRMLLDLEGVLVKYSEDQERDDRGRFASGGGGGESQPDPRTDALTLTRVPDRVWTHDEIDKMASEFNKQETGAVSENVSLAYLQQVEGHADAHKANMERSNYPVDQIHDHEVVEVKGGRADNTSGAMRWRLTFNTSPEEQALMKQMTPAAKAAYNKDKSAQIMVRKQDAMDKLQQEVGHPVSARTITTIVNHDTRTADIFSFNGLHKEISWKSPMVKDAYVGTYRY